MPDGFYPVWKDMPVPIPGAEGDLPVARGSDPLIGAPGDNALQPIWDAAPVTLASDEESAHSVSGLPMRPARMQSSETPPEPPTIRDRMPGTIDQP